MTKSTKTTIKEEMRAVDKRDFGWYKSLNDEEKKSLSMWQLQRFVSSVDSKVPAIAEHYLTITNDAVNTNFNKLSKHPELQFRLLQLAGIGTPQFHSWIAPGRASKTSKLYQFLGNFFKEYSAQELEMLLELNSKDDIKEMLMECGLQDDEIAEIFEEKPKSKKRKAK